jgi:hypothetical protein
VAALLVAIAVSIRPAVPVIWGDTPPFVESTLGTLEAGRPTVAGGRFLATFELEPLANTGGQDADFARLMDVNVRFSARPWFRAALLGTGGG